MKVMKDMRKVQIIVMMLVCSLLPGMGNGVWAAASSQQPGNNLITTTMGTIIDAVGIYDEETTRLVSSLSESDGERINAIRQSTIKSIESHVEKIKELQQSGQDNGENIVALLAELNGSTAELEQGVRDVVQIYGEAYGQAHSMQQGEGGSTAGTAVTFGQELLAKVTTSLNKLKEEKLQIVTAIITEIGQEQQIYAGKTQGEMSARVRKLLTKWAKADREALKQYLNSIGGDGSNLNLNSPEEIDPNILLKALKNQIFLISYSIPSFSAGGGLPFTLSTDLRGGQLPLDLSSTGGERGMSWRSEVDREILITASGSNDLLRIVGADNRSKTSNFVPVVPVVPVDPTLPDPSINEAVTRAINAANVAMEAANAANTAATNLASGMSALNQANVTATERIAIATAAVNNAVQAAQAANQAAGEANAAAVAANAVAGSSGATAAANRAAALYAANTANSARAAVSAAQTASAAANAAVANALTAANAASALNASNVAAAATARVAATNATNAANAAIAVVNAAQGTTGGAQSIRVAALVVASGAASSANKENRATLPPALEAAVRSAESAAEAANRASSATQSVADAVVTNAAAVAGTIASNLSNATTVASSATEAGAAVAAAIAAANTAAANAESGATAATAAANVIESDATNLAQLLDDTALKTYVTNSGPLVTLPSTNTVVDNEKAKIIAAGIGFMLPAKVESREIQIQTEMQIIPAQYIYGIGSAPLERYNARKEGHVAYWLSGLSDQSPGHYLDGYNYLYWGSWKDNLSASVTATPGALYQGMWLLANQLSVMDSHKIDYFPQSGSALYSGIMIGHTQESLKNYDNNPNNPNVPNINWGIALKANFSSKNISGTIFTQGSNVSVGSINANWGITGVSAEKIVGDISLNSDALSQGSASATGKFVGGFFGVPNETEIGGIWNVSTLDNSLTATGILAANTWFIPVGLDDAQAAQQALDRAWLYPFPKSQGSEYVYGVGSIPLANQKTRVRDMKVNSDRMIMDQNSHYHYLSWGYWNDDPLSTSTAGYYQRTWLAADPANITPGPSIPTANSIIYHQAVMVGYTNTIMESNINWTINNFTANFGNKTITGQFGCATDLNPNQSGTISGSWPQGVNSISGTIAAGTYGNGVFRGMFFGPAASEVGGVWNLKDAAGKTTTGVLAGKTN